MPLMNCKVYVELNRLEDCILSSDRDTAKFEITDTKLHVLNYMSTKDSANLAKQLNEGFERSVYWNSYETKPAKVIEQGKNLYELLNASFQGVKRLFVLAYSIAAPTAAGGNTDDTAGIKNNIKYFLPRGEIKNYNVLIAGRNFHNQQINDLIKQYDGIRKIPTGYGDE